MVVCGGRAGDAPLVVAVHKAPRFVCCYFSNGMCCRHGGLGVILGDVEDAGDRCVGKLSLSIQPCYREDTLLLYNDASNPRFGHDPH